MLPYLTFTTAKVKIKLLLYFFPNSHGCITYIVKVFTQPLEAHMKTHVMSQKDSMVYAQSYSKRQYQAFLKTTSSKTI